ncbi:hypothetical protein KY345_05740 [Candidatus Woesearchaeota archaeon]|nr:hypothetical protein [Candidatus Woesearchaeota archaeon]
MNLDKTVKINNIARELLKHGLVSTLEDGIEKAKEMTKDGVDMGEIEQTSDNETEQQQPSEQPSQASDQSNDMRIMERKLSYLAKTFAEQFNAEIGEVKKQIEMLNNDLKDIKEKIKQVQVQPQQEQQILEEEPKNAKKDDEEIKPRTGDYTPDNVELEDYFYFGNKKK